MSDYDYQEKSKSSSSKQEEPDTQRLHDDADLAQPNDKPKPGNREIVEKDDNSLESAEASLSKVKQIRDNYNRHNKSSQQTLDAIYDSYLERLAKEKILNFDRLDDKQKLAEKEKLFKAPEIRNEIEEQVQGEAAFLAQLHLAADDKNQLAVFMRISEDLKEQVINEFIAKKIPNYDQLSAAKKNEARAEFLRDPKNRQEFIKQFGKRFSDFMENLNKEIKAEEFGEASRKVFSTYTDLINEELSHGLKKLANRNLPLPTHLPIPVPRDEITGDFISVNQFLQDVVSGKVKANLPDFANSKEVPQEADVNRLKQAEIALQEINSADTPSGNRDRVQLLENQFIWLCEGKLPQAWLPNAKDMTERDAYEYCENAEPWLDVLTQVNDNVRALEALEYAPGDIDKEALAQSLKEGFPGKIKLENGVIRISPEYPPNLEPTEANLHLLQRLAEWVDHARQPLRQVQDQYDFASRSENLDKICYWGTVPSEGKYNDKEEYNQIRYEYSAKTVKVEVSQPDGQKKFEERIQVTTNKQHQWAGIFTTENVGEPVTSGCVSVNGKSLKTDGPKLYLSASGKVLEEDQAHRIKNFARDQSAAGMASKKRESENDHLPKLDSKKDPGRIAGEVRLDANGIIQVRASDNEGGVRIVDANGKSINLNQSRSSENWVSMLPGYILMVGDKKIELQNDVRYFKPNDLVAVRESDHIQLLRADRLEGQAEFSHGMEFLGEVVDKGMDVGFILSGSLEGFALRSAYRQMAKAAMERALERSLVKAAAETTVKTLAKAEVATVSAEAKAAMSGIKMSYQAANARFVNAQIKLAKDLQALRWSRNKNLALGVISLADQGIENYGNALGKQMGVDNAGKLVNDGVSLFMAADIFAGASSKLWGPLGLPGKIWHSMWGHADEALMASQLGKGSSLFKIKTANDNVLRLVDFHFGGDAIHGSIKDFSQTKQAIQHETERQGEAFQEIAARLKNVAGDFRMGQSAAEILSLLPEQDRVQVHVAISQSLQNTERSNSDKAKDVEPKNGNNKDKEVARLASIVSSDSDNFKEVDKLAAALALLTICTREDGSIPEIITSYVGEDGKEKIIRTEDLERTLMDYPVIRIGDRYNQSLQERFVSYVSAIVPELKDEQSRLLSKGTADVIKLPKDDPKREEHIRRLVDVFHGTNQSSQNKLAAAIGLLFIQAQGEDGAVRQKVGERRGWAIEPTVITFSDGGNSEQRYPIENLYVQDKDKALQIAEEKYGILRENQSFGPNSRLDFSFTPIKDTVSASEVIRYMSEQLASVKPKDTTASPDLDKKTNISGKEDYHYSASARLALSDLLTEAGQMDEKRQGNVCIEVLRESSSPEDKSKALESLSRILPLYAQGDEVKNVEVAVAKVFNAENQDPDVKGFTLALLDAIKAPMGKEREEHLQAVQKDWQEYKAFKSKGELKTSDFARYYASRLLRDLTAASLAPSSRLSEQDAVAKRQDSFRTTKNLLHLSEQKMVKFDGNENEQITESLFAPLRFLEDAGRKPFLNGTVLNMDIADKKLAGEALISLSSNIGLLNENENKNLDNQVKELRDKVIDILYLPNQNGNSYANALGETVLKTIAVENATKIFAKASNHDQDQLAQLLKKNIDELVIPSSNLADNERDQGQLSVEKLVMIEQAINCLNKMAQPNESQGKDAHFVALRAGVIDFLSNIALVQKQPPDELINPDVRLAAIQSLTSLRPFNLQEEQCVDKLCTTLANNETNFAIREANENLQKLKAVQDSDTYHRDYLKAKKEIEDVSTHINQAEARDYIKRNFPARLLTGAANNERLLNTHSKEENLALLEQSVDYLVSKVVKQGTNHEGIEARDALYLLTSLPDMVIPSLRSDVSILAAKGCTRICETGSTEAKTSMSKLMPMLLAHETMLSRDACRELIPGLCALGPKQSDVPIFSERQIATIVSMALEREARSTPVSPSDSQFIAGQNTQLYLLNTLEKYIGKEQIPLLVAFADEKRKSSVSIDSNGLIQSVNMSRDNLFSSPSVETSNGEIKSFAFTASNGKKDKWLKDDKTGYFFAEKDTEKTRPWNCSVKFLADGTFVINDPPHPDTQVPFSFYENTAQKDLRQAAFSPGGTLINAYGTETKFLPGGGKIERTELGPTGNAARWISITYPDGSNRTCMIDPTGKPTGKLGYIPSINERNNSVTDPATIKPVWLSNFSGEDIRSPHNYPYVDFESGVIIRRDYSVDSRYGSQLYINPNSVLKTYATTFYPDGHIVGQSETIDPLTKEKMSNILVESASFDDISSHSMPLVRDTARKLLSHLSENTSLLRQKASIDTTATPETLAQRLNNVVEDKPADPEKVVEAIFTAGLSRAIENKDDPRRATLTELLKNSDERIRLAVAHVLFEQSNLAEDKHAAALEFADIAATGSLVGYRQEAQELIDTELKHLQEETEKRYNGYAGERQYFDDEIMRFAFSNQYPHDIQFDSDRNLLRRMISDSHESIRLRAASKLFDSADPSDQQLVASTLSLLAKQAQSLAIRSEALKIVQECSQSKKGIGSERVLLETFAKLPWKELPKKASLPHTSLARLSGEDQSFKEKYGQTKLAIGASRENYLRQYRQELITDNPRFKLLDADELDKYTKDRAEYELGNWSWLGYKPDYKTQFEKSYEEMRQEIRDLRRQALCDTTAASAKPITATEALKVNQLKKEAHEARLILAHLALSDRGEIGDESIKVISSLAQGNSDDVYQMRQIIIDDLICDLTLSSSRRQVLFEGLKLNSRFASQTTQAAIKALETEYLTMPRDGSNPIHTKEYVQSENFHVALIKFLQETKYDGNLGTIKALSESSPSLRVRQAADYLLKSSVNQRLVSKDSDKITENMKASKKGKPALMLLVNSHKSTKPYLPDVTIQGA